MLTSPVSTELVHPFVWQEFSVQSECDAQAAAAMLAPPRQLLSSHQLQQELVL